MDGFQLSADTERFRTFFQLLKTSLERGKHHPLTLSVLLSGEPLVSQPLLQLLVEHCDRWEDVTLTMKPGQFSLLSNVKGRLDALERLSLDFDGLEPEIDHSDIFADAPNLKHVHLCAPHARLCPSLPWRRLHSFGYQADQDAREVSAFMALMANLSHPNAAFELRSLNAWDPNLTLNRPPITSTIASFLVDLRAAEESQRTVQVLGEVLGCLTLPRLRELHVICVRPWNTIPWPVTQFESLSERSSFHDTLCVLKLPNVTITEDELIRSLMSLDSLEYLIVSDQRFPWNLRIADHILITDSLLLRLTRSDEPPTLLVPRLNYFSCATFFNFRAQVYLNFIASRVVPDRPPFQSVLSRIGDAVLGVEPEDLQRLSEMVKKGQLRFYMADA
jgi:hypothetical protein